MSTAVGLAVDLAFSVQTAINLVATKGAALIKAADEIEDFAEAVGEKVASKV